MIQYGMMRLVGSNKTLVVRLHEEKVSANFDPNDNRFFFALQRKLGGRKGSSNRNSKPFTKRQLALINFL